MWLRIEQPLRDGLRRLQERARRVPPCPYEKCRVLGMEQQEAISRVEIVDAARHLPPSSDHQWSSVAINGHQWPSVAISGHQWSSVIITHLARAHAERRRRVPLHLEENHPLEGRQ